LASPAAAPSIIPPRLALIDDAAKCPGGAGGRRRAPWRPWRSDVLWWCGGELIPIGAGLRQEATILLDRSPLLSQRLDVVERLRFRLALQQVRQPAPNVAC